MISKQRAFFSEVNFGNFHKSSANLSVKQGPIKVLSLATVFSGESHPLWPWSLSEAKTTETLPHTIIIEKSILNISKNARPCFFFQEILYRLLQVKPSQDIEISSDSEEEQLLGLELFGR